MDVEKTIESIVSAVQRLTDAHVTLTGDVQELRDLLERVAHNQFGMSETMAVLAAHVAQLAAAQKRSDERLDGLSEKVAQTTDNLNALIKVVDDLIRRNGGRPQ